MASSRCATSILLDISKSCLEGSQWDPKFLEQSLDCIRRMMVKKFFSGGFDLLSLTFFGSDNTSNSLDKEGFYENVEEVFRLTPPTWKLYRELDNVKASSETSSNLLEALTVALDDLRKDTANYKSKVKTRQIVVFSNFASDCDYEEDVLKDLIRSLSQYNVQVIAIGLDFEKELEGKESNSELPGNLGILAQIFTELEDFATYTLEEALTNLQYYDKQKKTGQIISIDLLIGSKIRIPVKWIKATTDPFRIEWKPQTPAVDRSKNLTSATSKLTSTVTSAMDSSNRSINEDSKIDPAIQVRYMTDVKRKTRFGASEVILTAADSEAMKRENTISCFQYLGCTKRKKINRDMLVGDKFYMVLPDDKKPNSHPHFAAFVDALIEMDSVALCRRVLQKNGRVYLGVLLPVSDENGKAFYFHQLPRKEWTLELPREDEIYNISDISLKEEKDIMKDFIRSRTLSKDVFSEGNGVMVKDPYFQHICNLIELRALNKLNCNEIDYDIPKHILKIINPISRSEQDEPAKNLKAILVPNESEKFVIKNRLEAFESAKDLLNEESKDYIIENNYLIPLEDLLKALGRAQAEDIKNITTNDSLVEPESIDKEALFKLFD